MLFDALSEKQKWLVALLCSFCMLIVLVPVLFGWVNKIGDVVGIKLTDSKGCSSMIGVAVQILLFFILVRLIIHLFSRKKSGDNTSGDNKTEGFNSIGQRIKEMEIVKNKYYPEYKGLVSPADMMHCNAAQLEAEKARSPECYDAARACLSNPFGKECADKINTCTASSSDPDLARLVLNSCGFVYKV